MRTVHETEALRPSDPVPKSMQTAAGAGGKGSKLKIIIKTPQSHAAGQDDAVDDGGGGGGGGSGAGDEAAAGESVFTPLSEEQGFTAEELAMPLERLARLCRLQVRWAEEEGERLRAECRRWEELYRREWLEKEALLEQVVRSEREWHARRQAVLSGAADVVVAGPGEAAGATASAGTGADANGAAKEASVAGT